MERLYLLDAYALIYRAYYALIRSPRVNSKGENTSAVYGFVTTLEELLREAPDYVAVAFDPGGKTFRHEAYPAYKAQREATPEDIRRAVPIIKDVLQAYRIPVVEVPGFEADDVIGTLSKQAARAGLEVRMVTPDKDYAQLVEPHILMQRPARGSTPWELLGPAEVEAKYGLNSPAQVIDYLALTGDASDNVPGCPGVGPKTAAKLLREYGSVEALLAATDTLKGSLKTRVAENAEQIRFSKFLTTIRIDVPLTLDLPTLRRREPDVAKLSQLFSALEFRTLLARLGGGRAALSHAEPSLFDALPPAAPAATPEAAATPLATYDSSAARYHLVETEEARGALAAQLAAAPTVSLDTETTSTDALAAKLVGLSFALEAGEAWYVPIPQDEDEARRIVGLFRSIYESPTIMKVGQNLKYDLTVLASYGVRLAAPMYDTMLAHYVVQPELRHNMDDMAEHYLHYRTIHIEELLGPKGRGQKNMADLAPQDVYAYACEDADITLRLMQPLTAELEATGTTHVFRDMEMPLMPVLAGMERHGVRVDTQALAAVGQDFNARLQQVEAEIYALAGHSFLVSSPRQVGEVLFGELHLTEGARKTKGGQFSTSEEVLEKLRPRHPIVQKILDYRALKKLLSTYVEALPRLVNPATGHIHTSFNQAVTATGRLSSSNPNLQNIPVRGEDGREIRRAFIPEEGEVFLSADYSQIELRIMAHLSQDAHLLEAFRSGKDVHAATAARIFHKDIADVTRDERRKAKTANFGIIYGISAFGLAERMGVPRAEARELIESYFKTYPGVRAYIDRAVEQAREKGYIETAFGRRRYLPDINSRNATVRGYAERNAVNAPIQGTAADIIKLAMVAIAKRIKERHLRASMILQVHDELNFSVPPAELDEVRTLVVGEMERAFPMSVPLVAECGTGANWLEAH